MSYCKQHYVNTFDRLHEHISWKTNLSKTNSIRKRNDEEPETCMIIVFVVKKKLPSEENLRPDGFTG